MNPLQTVEEYELFIYKLVDNFPSVHRSTVTFVRRGLSLACVTGELFNEFYAAQFTKSYS